MLRREGFQFFDPLLNPLVGTNDLQDSILETVAHTTIRRRLNFAQNWHALGQPSCGLRPDPFRLEIVLQRTGRAVHGFELSAN